MLPNEKQVMLAGNERRHPMRVELGARVRTTDGKDVGTIDRLIVDPSNNEIKAAVIHKGMILPRDVEVPLSAIEPETDVSTGSAALDREAREALERQDLENAVIGEGSDVVDRDGENVGEVARLVFVPDGHRLTSLVVRKGFIFTEDRELPASVINRVDDGVIYLKVGKQELNL